MKHQAPTSKHQKSSNGQAPNTSGKKSSIIKYSHVSSHAWVLNEEPNAPDSTGHPFDLEERTAQFGEAIVRFSKKIPRDPGNNRLIDQLVGCGTSVGANYREANESVSKKDFLFSTSRCVKEAKETKFFLRMVAASEELLVKEARELYRECHELHMIFASMYRKGRK
jgi:four helix bundle protein